MSSFFNYIIIGAGNAGLQLCLEMTRNSYFKDKTILLLDPDEKKTNDKTWCFWQKGPGNFDSLLHHKWPKGRFITENETVDMDMRGYVYKMVRAIDFYSDALEIINNSDNVTLKKESVQDVNEIFEVITESNTYRCDHIFDSRIPQEFFKDTKSVTLKQHFLGWIIETENDIFDPERFDMMDFRNRKNDTTSFFYTLPFTGNKALIEFTFFDENILSEQEYEYYLEKYLSEIIGLGKYNVVEKESGIIPMSTYPFHKHHLSKLTKIGTGGGWVKPSTGYSFKATSKYVKEVVQNIIQGKNPSKNIATGRHRFYDKIFLQVLKDHNELGPQYFEKLYLDNPPDRLFRFLDEKSDFSEDVKIMAGFTNSHFMKALWKSIT